MSLLCALCCLTIGGKEDPLYKELPSKGSFQAKIKYTIEDKRCVRNGSNHFYCMLCKEEIPDNTAPISECCNCKKYVGHYICVRQNNFKCPSCGARP